MRTFVLVHERARDTLHKVIDNIPLDGKMKVEIKKVTSKRSEAQNRLYWMWVKLIADELGYSSNDMHEHLVQEFITPEVKEIMGQQVTIWPSTTKLGVKAFTKYLNHIDVWANSEQGIVLPKPMDDYHAAMGQR